MIGMNNVLTRGWQPILLGIGFVMLLLIGALSIYLANQSRQDAAEVARTLEIQNQLSAVLLNTRRAESAQRGLLLSGYENHLTEYKESRDMAPFVLSGLREAVKERAVLQGMFAAEKILAAKLNEMDETIASYQAGKRDDAVQRMRDDSGRILMDSLRRQIEDMLVTEARLLADRIEESEQTSRWLLITTLFGIAMIGTIGALSVTLMQRANRQRQNALTELEATNSNLESIVAYRTADLTEANEEIQRFAYIVSHDLRSPLVNIMGFTSELEALRGDIFTEVQSLRAKVAELEKTAEGNAGSAGAQADQLGKDFDEALGFIKSSITKMDRLINAVLRLSREGRRDFRPEPIDMTAMVRQLEASVAHQAQEADADIVVSDLPEVVSDRLALEQVFSNLLDNAVKYLKRGEPGHIEVRGSSTPKSVIYEVRDNGRGIDPADHQRIFELFRRSGQQDRPGEGIGLAHVRALVRRLGGNLTVSSELGQGSVFTVALPRRWSAEERKAA